MVAHPLLLWGADVVGSARRTHNSDFAVAISGLVPSHLDHVHTTDILGYIQFVLYPTSLCETGYPIDQRSKHRRTPGADAERSILQFDFFLVMSLSTNTAQR